MGYYVKLFTLIGAECIGMEVNYHEKKNVDGGLTVRPFKNENSAPHSYYRRNIIKRCWIFRKVKRQYGWLFEEYCLRE